MKAAATAAARGSTAIATLDFIRRTYGSPLLDTILERVEGSRREQLLSAATTDELPYDTLLELWRSADDALRAAHPKWMEESGAYAIDSLGQQLYSGLLHKASPAEFITQSVSLFRLYYRPGDMVPVEVEADRAVLRLVGFDPLSTLFCRRQTGGLIRASELAGGKEVRVTHVRCSQEGDLYCEWQIRWR